MAPRDLTDASASKTSLLWAYQLRQEHVHLVGRIDSIDADLHSSTEKTSEFRQSFSDLQALVKTLEAENRALKNELRSMNGELSGAMERLNLFLKTIPENINKIEDGFESMALRVKELAKDALELRIGIGKVENKCALLEKKQVDMKPTLLLRLKYSKKAADACMLCMFTE
jgi:chromosome segregation ATPase